MKQLSFVFSLSPPLENLNAAQNQASKFYENFNIYILQ